MASLHVTKPLHPLGDPSFPCTSKGIKNKVGIFKLERAIRQ